MFPFLLLMGLFNLIWFILAVDRAFRSRICCQRNKNGRKVYEHESPMTNFMVRFLYEISLEVILCAFISLTFLDIESNETSHHFSIGSLCLVALAIFGLIFLSCKVPSRAETPMSISACLGYERIRL